MFIVKVRRRPNWRTKTAEDIKKKKDKKNIRF